MGSIETNDSHVVNILNEWKLDTETLLSTNNQ